VKRKRRRREERREEMRSFFVLCFLVLVGGFLEDKAFLLNSLTKLTDDSRDFIDLSGVEDHVLGCGLLSFRIRELIGRIAEVEN